MLFLNINQVPTDSTGLILTVVSILVVFSALFLLYLLFSLSSKVFSTNKKKIENDDNEIALAIALALEQHLNKEEFVLTFENKTSNWSDKRLNFRKLPR